MLSGYGRPVGRFLGQGLNPGFLVVGHRDCPRLAYLAAQQSLIENLYFLINMQYRRHLGLELRVPSLHIVTNLMRPAARSYAAWSGSPAPVPGTRPLGLAAAGGRSADRTSITLGHSLTPWASDKHSSAPKPSPHPKPDAVCPNAAILLRPPARQSEDISGCKASPCYGSPPGPVQWLDRSDRRPSPARSPRARYTSSARCATCGGAPTCAARPR